MEISPRQGNRLIIALLMLLAPLAAIAAEPVDIFVALAADPARQTEMKARVAEWKLVGGHDDFTPLANRLVKASIEQVSPESSLVLAELAVEAAPGDPYAQHNMMGAALAKRDYGRAILAGSAWINSWLNDPWLYQATVGRALMALGMAAMAATLAILLCCIPFYLPLAIHDLSDRFPERARRYAPVGAALLGLAALFAAGGGAAALIIAPSLVVMLYVPLRVRIALVVLVPAAMLVFPALLTAEKYAGPGGDRAYALYRVWKGDSGADLEGDLVKYYGKTDYRSLIAQAFSARRSGDQPRAQELLKLASKAGGSDSRFVLSQQGAVAFMLGNVDEAAALYRKSSESNPDDWRAWYNLAAVDLAKLDLAGAEAARARAVALAPAEVERQQNLSSDAGGNIYPAFENFPQAWVSEALDEASVSSEGWSEALWAWLGLSFGFFRPIWVVGLMFLGFIGARAMDRFRPSRRCVSCGEIKCPRCHRVVKDPNLCIGCWAMSHESAIDPESRKRRRESVTWWTMESRSARRWGNTLLPGWNSFVYAGGVGAPLLGAIWAAALGLAMAESFARIPLGAWANAAVAIPALVLVALIHVLSGLKSLHN